MVIKDALKRVGFRKHLSQDAAYAVMMDIMAGKVSDAQLGALMTALMMKGETINEIVGFARAIREKVFFPIETNDTIIDLCGTGGDRKYTFNISTASALVAAGAGCKVAKHGNRAVSSLCGSADVMEQFGVKIDQTPQEIIDSINSIGIGFIFSAKINPAMKNSLKARQELELRTIFNLLGPLTNPFGVKHHLLGVYDPDLTEIFAEVCRFLGWKHCLIVHGHDDTDEISICDRTKITELKDNKIETFEISPGQFGFQRRSIDAIKGGNPDVNAQIIRDLLNGRKGAHRDVVLLNAGVAIYVSGKASTILEGIQIAADAIDSGKAQKKLDQLIEFSTKS